MKKFKIELYGIGKPEVLDFEAISVKRCPMDGRRVRILAYHEDRFPLTLFCCNYGKVLLKYKTSPHRWNNAKHTAFVQHPLTREQKKALNTFFEFNFDFFR